VKLFAPGSKEVGKLSNIRLPPLADIPGYVPPPLTSVMSITFNPQGEHRVITGARYLTSKMS
jgi:hypothetical protein